MSRFRHRPVIQAAPGPGTILPGVPFVPRGAGDLIPRQRVHDPLSDADRHAVMLADLAKGLDAPTGSVAPAAPAHEPEDVVVAELDPHPDDAHDVEPAEEGHIVDAEIVDPEIVDPEIVDPVPADTDTPDADAIPGDAVAGDNDGQEDGDAVADPMEAIDTALIELVARRRPRLVPVAAPVVAGPPTPERLRLMVGVLARDFGRSGSGRPPVPESAHPDPRSDWGPWPAPHTSAWPVVVPPWGAVPQGFCGPLPGTLTRSA